MRRHWLLISLVLLWLLPGPAEAQCRKRILVFLDISGSMRPKDPGPSSPFQQSLGAIDDLLQQQGLIEANDVLEVVLFGESAGRQEPARGRDQAAALIKRLKTNKESSNVTDFRLFLDSLDGLVKDPSTFNSQLVLLGSDLVHERVDVLPNAEDLQDWAAVLSEKAAVLQEIRDNSARTSYVFFVPEAPKDHGGRKPVQAKVLDDLQRLLPRVRPVSPSSGRAGLAAELRRGLLAAPQLTISRDEDPKKLAFIISNPNCSPLRLKALTVQQTAEDGTASEPVRFEIPEDEALLGGTGTKEGTRTLFRAIPSGPAWEKVDRLQGSVEVDGGPTGTTKGTAGSWLKVSPQQGVLERYLLFSPLLRLDLEVQGHTEEPRTYTLTVRAAGQAEDSPPLAEGKIEAPDKKLVKPTGRLVMRAVLPASRDLYDEIAKRNPVRISLEGAQFLDPKKDQVEILADPLADRSNLFLLVASAFSLLVVVYGLARVKAIVRRYPALNHEPKGDTLWAVMAGLSLLPAASNFLHLRLLHAFSPETVDWLTGGLSVAVVFTTLTFTIRSIQKVRFGRRVLSADPPLSLEKYRWHSRLGVWLPFVAGALVTALFATTWFLVRPTVTGKLGRDANPPQLRIVSD